MKKIYLSSLLCFGFVLCGLMARATAGVPVVAPIPNTSGCSGTTAMFVANATVTPSTDALAYSWQVSTDGGSTWSNVVYGGAYSGAGTDTLSVLLSSGLNGNDYRAIVTDTDSSMSDTSNAALLTVIAPVDAEPVTGPAATCIGSTIHLTDALTAGGTATWSVSNGNASVNEYGQVTGIAAGVDTIYYTFTGTCNTVTSQYEVTVDAPADAGTITGHDTVCAGSWITLTDAAGGGIWISSNTDVAVVDGSGDVTGIAGGTATISYYVANACGAYTASQNIIVNAVAAGIAGSDSVGVAHTITLTDSTTGGVWSVSNSHAAVSATGVVTGASAGMDTVYYTVTNTCGTTQASKTVIVGAVPAAGAIYTSTGKDTVCTGSAIQVHDTTAAATGVWSIKNAHATINSTGFVTGISVGLDTAVYTVTNVYGTSTSYLPIYVSSIPAVTVDTLTLFGLGSTYTLSGSPAGGTWYVDQKLQIDTVFGGYDSVRHADSVLRYDTVYNTVASIIDQNLLVVLAPGTDTVFYTVTNFCGTRKSDFIMTVVALGVNQVNTASVETKVYPNPSQGAFKVHVYTTNNENATLTITNIAGERVAMRSVATNTDESINLDVPSGIYLVNVVTSEGTFTTKINVIR